jgi:hypothetical protein
VRRVPRESLAGSDRRRGPRTTFHPGACDRRPSELRRRRRRSPSLAPAFASDAGTAPEGSWSFCAWRPMRTGQGWFLARVRLCVAGWKRRLPALSSLRGHSPAQACPRLRTRVCAYVMSSPQRMPGRIGFGAILSFPATGEQEPRWNGRLDHSGICASIKGGCDRRTDGRAQDGMLAPAGW